MQTLFLHRSFTIIVHCSVLVDVIVGLLYYQCSVVAVLCPVFCAISTWPAFFPFTWLEKLVWNYVHHKTSNLSPGLLLVWTLNPVLSVPSSWLVSKLYVVLIVLPLEYPLYLTVYMWDIFSFVCKISVEHLLVLSDLDICIAVQECYRYWLVSTIRLQSEDLRYMLMGTLNQWTHSVDWRGCSGLTEIW